jgi:hypothetical protein
MRDEEQYRAEIWEGEVFRGFAATFNQILRIEDLLRTCTLPETEVRYWTAYAEHLPEDQATGLIRRLEANQAESSDPRQQFIDRLKIMP